MWRAIGWMLVVVLSSAVSEAAGQEAMNARRPATRPALVRDFSQAFNRSEERLRQEAPTLSESRRMSLLRSLRPEEERLYALLRAHPDNVDVQRLAMTAVLLRGGRSIDEAASASRVMHHGSSAAPLRTALPSPADIIDRVATGLPSDSVLLTFVAYVDRQDSSQQRYLALVLFPDARIRAIDLGPAAAIDSTATSLSTALADKDAAYQADAEKLYTLAFQPVRSLLGNTRHIYLALDGQLSFIPFDVLHDGHQSLIDAFDFTYLNSGRDLLQRPKVLPASDSVVVFADPILGAGPTARPVAATAMLAMADVPFISTDLFPLRGELADTPWLPLPGTRQEAEAIQRLYPQAQLFLGTDATKERLLHLRAPAVLHLATHGYVLDGAAAPEGTRGLGRVNTFSDAVPAPRFLDPMLRSGLVLSDSEDGKTRSEAATVTARELVDMDLWGTELVVLSACDTGRGDVEPGQGVYGLRRAFLVAGAETVVMSLWKVNDDATRQLMESYYRNLRAGQGRDDALREAMRTLRKTHPHPHDWAAFISLGQDTPLHSL